MHQFEYLRVQKAASTEILELREARNLAEEVLGDANEYIWKRNRNKLQKGVDCNNRRVHELLTTYAKLGDLFRNVDNYSLGEIYDVRDGDPGPTARWKITDDQIRQAVSGLSEELRSCHKQLSGLLEEFQEIDIDQLREVEEGTSRK